MTRRLGMQVLSRCASCDDLMKCRSLPLRRIVKERRVEIENRMHMQYGPSYKARRIYVCDTCADTLVVKVANLKKGGTT